MYFFFLVQRARDRIPNDLDKSVNILILRVRGKILIRTNLLNLLIIILKKAIEKFYIFEVFLTSGYLESRD